MKSFLATALLVVLTPYAQAQDTPSSKTPRQEIEVAAPRPPITNQVSTNALANPKQPALTYSGLATDIRKATNKWKLFHLRRPLNVKEDEANLIRDLRTEAAPAIKIISVDF